MRHIIICLYYVYLHAFAAQNEDFFFYLAIPWQYCSGASFFKKCHLEKKNKFEVQLMKCEVKVVHIKFKFCKITS